MINRDQLLKAAPLKREQFTVPGHENLGSMTVREFSFGEQQEYSKIGQESTVAGIAFALSHCVEGLEDITAEDVDGLSPDVVTSITHKIFELSGLIPGTVDDIEGN